MLLKRGTLSLIVLLAAQPGWAAIDETKLLDLTIQVQNQLLPPPKQWGFRLDLWQNPWVISEYYKVKPWSNEHKTLLKGYRETR